jgi:hypothetical protein
MKPPELYGNKKTPFFFYSNQSTHIEYKLPTTGNWLIDRAAQLTPRSGYGCPLMRNIKL